MRALDKINNTGTWTRREWVIALIVGLVVVCAIALALEAGVSWFTHWYATNGDR